jgi:hypothetical protein
MLHRRRYGDKEMKRFRIALLTFVCLLCAAADLPFLLAQHGSVTVDWKAELAKAKAGIAKNPKSAFWHNQAGVAYDALGEFANAVKELKLASTLARIIQVFRDAKSLFVIKNCCSRSFCVTREAFA